MKLTLTDRQKIFDDVETLIFEPEQPIEWQAGQYLHYVLPHGDEDDRGPERWFTISAPPYLKQPSITTRFTEGKGSSFKQSLRAMKIGNSLGADGPKGKFVIDNPAKTAILIAGGIGITPYYSMLLQLDYEGQGIKAELLYANRDDNFIFGGELAGLEQKHPDFHIHKFAGGHGIKKSDIKLYTDDPDTIFYVSGPEPMVENYADTLKQIGLPDERVKTDFFPGY